jgi:hypothetical protein
VVYANLCIVNMYLQGGCSCVMQVVQAFVKLGLSYIDKAPDKETKVELIKTLQSVTEGKVWASLTQSQKYLVGMNGSIRDGFL